MKNIKSISVYGYGDSKLELVKVIWKVLEIKLVDALEIINSISPQVGYDNNQSFVLSDNVYTYSQLDRLLDPMIANNVPLVVEFCHHYNSENCNCVKCCGIKLQKKRTQQISDILKKGYFKLTYLHKETGIDRNTLSAYKCGKCLLTKDHFDKLTEVLVKIGVELTELMK